MGPKPLEFLVCKICNQLKPRSAFYLRYKNNVSIKVRAYCKECNTAVCKQYRDKNPKIIKKLNAKKRHILRAIVLEHLAKNHCIDCNEADPLFLDFDHIDRSTKSHSISQLVGGRYTEEKLRAEMAKCVIRCVKCHRRKTAIESGWFKYTELLGD